MLPLIGKCTFLCKESVSIQLTFSDLLAGRRYSYKIIMSSNVGYKDNGDPIKPAPIKFSVNEVAPWDDVAVTINL